MVWVWAVGVGWAGEGMWSPDQLPELGSMMAAEGIKVSPTEMADLAHGPLAGVVLLGGCTGSFVSPDGLVLTNHHCVSGYLQYASTEAHDWYAHGFVAADRATEAWAGPAARIWVVEHSVDVTATLLSGLKSGLSDTARKTAIETASKREIATCEAEAPGRKCWVTSYYGGLRYRLTRELEIRDVRVVFAPPSTVGDYGGEIDNFQWPRHAGDYAFLRLWVGPDGAPADHDAANIPYKPVRYGTIDPTGVVADEPVWVAGYPGNTDRHEPVWATRPMLEEQFPLQIERLDTLVDLLDDFVATHPSLAGKVLPTVHGLANGQKYREGVLDALRGVDVVALKQARWDAVVAWASADRKRAKTWGPALEELQLILTARAERWTAETTADALMRYGDLLANNHRIYRWSLQRAKADADREIGFQDRDRDLIAGTLAALPDSFVPGAERLVFAQTLAWYEALPADRRVAPLDAFLAAHGGAAGTLDALFADRPYPNADALDQTPEAHRASTDPWMQLAIALEDGWLAGRRARDKAEDGALSRVMPLYMEAVLASSKGAVYPDANGTLRVSFGAVRGYTPRDGLVASPFTTVPGMVAKDGPPPFDAPDALIAAASGSEGSPYVDPVLGQVPVNFLSTVDITGGNSGSATFDAEGNVVGVVFDGVYESMACDLEYVPAVNRAIHVDIRYILWSLDALGGHAVVEELTR